MRQPWFSSSAQRAGPLAAALFWRGLFLAILWWVLSGDRGASWLIGLPCLALALLASLWLTPPGELRFSPLGLLVYLGFFLGESLRGGLQVARLALGPRLALQPAVLEIRLRLPPGIGRALLANTLSLQPGTLSLDLVDDRLRLHVLDGQAPVVAQVRRAEARIARLLRVGLR